MVLFKCDLDMYSGIFHPLNEIKFLTLEVLCLVIIKYPNILHANQTMDTCVTNL